MLLVPAFFLFASSMRIVSGAEWCYQSQVTCNHTCTGPDAWGEVNQQCSGRSQSPVNIVTRRVLPDDRLTPFHLTRYQETFHAELTNNGHTVQLELPSSIKIAGGKLDGKYKAVQLHLHWGKDGGPGSEHMIDGEQFPMEMHIVHIKEEYESLSQAVKDHAGVAVLGFFFQDTQSIIQYFQYVDIFSGTMHSFTEQSNDKSRLYLNTSNSEFTSANKNYDLLINALKTIPQPSNSTTLTGVSLDMFLPSQENMTKYFRYDGSLTTPDCDEAVVWSLFENAILLSREQLAAFSQLQLSNGQQMVKTYRPVQPLNGRQVYYSRGHVALVSTGLLIMSMLLSNALSLHTAA